VIPLVIAMLIEVVATLIAMLIAVIASVIAMVAPKPSVAHSMHSTHSTQMMVIPLLIHLLSLHLYRDDF
jgi:uncharacterized membrane protein